MNENNETAAPQFFHRVETALGRFRDDSGLSQKGLILIGATVAFLWVVSNL